MKQKRVRRDWQAFFPDLARFGVYSEFDPTQRTVTSAIFVALP